MSQPATTTAVILTMPRSGSSLLAGVLHRLGVPMGRTEDLEAGTHLNRFGCFEDQEFQFISLNILTEAGLLIDLSTRLELDEAVLAETVARYGDRLKAFVRRRSGTLWGFKDPGLIYSLPHLHHHFENPRHLHLVRDPADTAASLHRTYRPAMWLPELRAKWSLLRPANRARVILGGIRLMATPRRSRVDRTLYEEVIRHGHRRIRDFLGDRPRLEIDLPELVANSNEVIGEIAAFLDFEPAPGALEAAEAFVHPELLQGRDHAAA